MIAPGVRPVLVVCALLILGPPPARALDLVREFRYDAGRVALRQHQGFAEISARGGLPEYRAGRPALPRVPETVDLPDGYRVERVEIAALETEPLADHVRPAPAPEIRRGAEVPVPAVPDPEAYGRSGWQPEAPATLGYQGFERGRNRAMLLVSPVRWDAASGRMERVRRIAVRMVLAPSNQRPLVRERVVPEWESSAPSGAVAAGPLQSALPPGAQPYRPTQVPSLLGSPVAYVIVTNEAMQAPFQQLADWKTQCGTPAVVRTVSFIRQQYPSGVDDAERVRMFIRDAYSRWGTRWVLLGGDVDVIPARIIHTTAYGGADIPSDAYYSCLDGTWNADGDSLWGEGWINSSYPGDSADLLPEVWVGRAPTQTAQDAQLFVNKTLSYERTPISDYMTNLLFFAQVLFPQPWNPGQATFLDGAELVDFDVLPVLDEAPWLHPRRLYQNYTDSRWRAGALPENRRAVIDSLNRGYNIAVHVGHGYITVMSCGDANLSNEDAYALTNGARLMNLYAIDCTSNAIDSQSLGEAYMRAPNGGAVTSIGSTQLDFPDVGRVFQREYFRLMIEDSITAVGEAQARQKLPFVVDAYYDGLTRWTITTLLLLGDPDLRIFTNTPRVLTVGAPASMLVSDSTITVSVSIGATPLYGARVTAYMAGRDYRSVTTDGAGNAVVPFHPDSLGSVAVTVTAFNAKPVQRTVSVVASGIAALEEQAVTVVDDNLSGRRGNGNGLLDAGEIVDLRIPVRNTGGGSASSVNGTLSTTDGLISISSPAVSYGTIGPGSVSSPSAGYRVSVPYDCGDQREVPFKLDLVTGTRHVAQTFSIVVRAPELVHVSHTESETGGNGNGRPDPGETVSYAFRIRNLGTGESHGITGRLRCYDGLASVLDSAFTVPDLAAGAETTATTVRFVPSSTGARLTLLLSDAYGLRTTQTLDLGYPAPVITLQAAGGNGAVHLTWAHSGASDLAGYSVYRRTAGVGAYRKVNVVPSGRSSVFDDVGLANLTRYDYMVAAMDSSGNESTLSAPVAATTNPPPHPGFPIVFGHSSPSPVTVDWLTPGTTQSILVGGDVLYLYRADGTAPVDADGSPDTPGDFTTHGNYYAGGGAISDLDGDGTKEVIGAAWNSQQLWVFEPNGSVRAGFPAALRNQVWSSVAVGDLDGNGTKEMVFGSLNTIDNNLGKDLFVFRSNGAEWMDGDANPATLGVFKVMGANYNLGTPALADLLGNGQNDIIFGSFDGNLYAWRPDGSNLPGFPVNLVVPITASVAVGRLDGPGSAPSIVVAASNDSIYVIRSDGGRRPGFPVWAKTSGVSMSPSPALADMDGDGTLDIVYAATNGWIVVRDRNGAPLAPWGNLSRFSNWFDSANQSSPVVADINGDGLNDVVVGDETGALSALSGATGQMLAGFPIQLGAAATGTPALCDCDGDGKTEIVTMDYGRTLYMWDYDYPFAPAARSAWPQFHHDAEHTGNADTRIVLAVGGDAPPLSRVLVLSAPRPSPARGPVEIAWGVPADQAGQPGEVAVFDLSGRQVRVLDRGPALPGPHTTRWDLRDQRGAPARSGVYFVRVRCGANQVAKKLLVVR